MVYKALTRNLVESVIISMFFSASVSAAEVTFDWTGQFTVQNQYGELWSNGITGLPQTAVSGTFTFDTANPNLSNMDITLETFSFYSTGDTSLTLNSMEELNYTTLFGSFNLLWSGDLGDGNGYQSYNMDMGVVWDVTGLRDAIDSTPGGLQVGDTISGDTVLRGGVPIQGINSATPATDGIEVGFQSGVFLNQGPAPMATTTLNYGWYLDYNNQPTFGISDDGIGGMPVDGMPYNQYASISLDIGSGNSMTVTNVVPIPAAVWLFGSGLLGLVGVARRKKA